MARTPVILTIAGFDPTQGAGLSADSKTIHALGGYAASVVTTLTAQNSQGVSAVFPVPIDVVCAQLDAVRAEFDIAAVKVGLLATRGQIEAVASALASSGAPVVCDPVAVASAGGALVVEDTAAALCQRLFPLCTCVTPNQQEARVLAQDPVTTDPSALGHRLRAMGRAHSVLVTGGDVPGTTITDVWCGPDGATVRIEHDRVQTVHTHGTGCTLSAALATFIAQGHSLEAAARQAVDYTHRAVTAAPDLGVARGPVGQPGPA